MSRTAPLYQCPAFQEAGGPVLRPGGLGLTERGLDLCGFAPGARVGDMGCGRGASLGLLERLGFRPLGLDPDRAFLAQARSEARSALLARATAQALPLRDACLDGLVCECVLSVLDEPGGGLAEMARTLRPGGRLLLTDLYLREPARGLVPGCVAGAVTRQDMEARLLAAGLRPLVFEDHGRALRELAGRLIFAHGSLERFWRQALGRDCACPDLRAVSYGLLVAEKEIP